MSLYAKNILILIVSILTISCTSSKGYTGDKLPNDKLAILKSERNTTVVDNSVHYEELLIIKVGDLELGNHIKGWPKTIKIKPGEQIIEFRHARPWTYPKNYVSGAVGGAISGLVIANQIEKKEHHHFIIKFNAQEGCRYTIRIETKSRNIDNPKIILKNKTNGENVDFEVNFKKVKHNKE